MHRHTVHEQMSAANGTPQLRVRGGVDERPFRKNRPQGAQFRRDVPPQSGIGLLVDEPRTEHPRVDQRLAHHGGSFVRPKMPCLGIDYQHIGNFTIKTEIPPYRDNRVAELRAHFQRTRQIVGQRQYPFPHCHAE